MKKVIKNTKKGILMVAMLAASLSFANEGTPFFTIKNESERTSLTLALVKEGNLLSIKDYNGMILYKEVIQKTGTYTKGFDLTALPNGKYIFELDSDIEIKTIPFTVETNTVVFEKDMEKSIFKPVTRVKGNIVFVSQLTLNNKPLKIDIYFEGSNNSELVLTETIKDTKCIERIYKLTGLKNGNYTMVFNTEGREFIKHINN
ncbi:hypothetical protein [Confluentibacter flavum]|uniref:Secretion system C-terminal sorting domain-containing protein n=1 Tax=Confluentibacter flavum TaxID=1909700 RepID=A0A2N3HLB1_9FLAO|nr:hypothetical protein [Confluentibacter flavum]PKQ45664.1 hypothetical protein CSW08_06240 [Confluentibacter flavum]